MTSNPTKKRWLQFFDHARLERTDELLLKVGALSLLLETARRRASSVDAMEPAEGILLIL